MMDVVEALVHAVEEIVQPALAAADHSGRVPDAAVVAGSPAVIVVTPVGRVRPPGIGRSHEQDRSPYASFDRPGPNDYVDQLPVQVVHRRIHSLAGRHNGQTV